MLEKGLVFRIANSRVIVSRIFALGGTGAPSLYGALIQSARYNRCTLRGVRAVFAFDMQSRTIVGADVYKREQET